MNGDTARERVRAATRAREPWYEERGEKAAKLVFERVKALRAGPLATYRTAVRRRMQLYAGSQNVSGLTTSSDQIRYNLFREFVGTGVATLTAARTLPYAQTRGADWNLRRKVISWNAAMQQRFFDIGVYNESLQVIMDALVGGLGSLRFYADPTREGGQVGCERLVPLSYVWDPAEAVTPRGITQHWIVRPVNREWLATLYPNRTDAIIGADSPSEHDLEDFHASLGESRAGQVMVIEAHKLPTTPDSGDGWTGLYTSKGMLYEREWCSVRSPVAHVRGWEPAQVGNVGVSMVELLEPAQRRIDRLCDFVDACQDAGSKPWLFSDQLDGVEECDLDNIPMRMIKVKPGAHPPQMQTFDATPHDLERAVQIIREQQMQEFGLNSTHISGETPAGLNAAVALRTYAQLQSKRHVANVRWIEQYYLDCAWCMIDAIDALVEEVPTFEIETADREEWLDTLKWSEIRPDDADARLAVFPMASLVGEPAAAFQSVSEWTQLGWLAPSAAKFLQLSPDLEAHVADETEDEQYAYWLCSKIDKGEKVFVEQYADPNQVLGIMRKNYLAARRLSGPDNVLREYRRQLDMLQGRIQGEQAATAPAPAPAPTGPAPQLPGMMGGPTTVPMA